jgi:hypothetical protein
MLTIGVRTPPRGPVTAEPPRCSLKTLHDLVRLTAGCQTESLPAIIQTLVIAIHEHHSQAAVNTQPASSSTRCATPSNPLARTDTPQTVRKMNPRLAPAEALTPGTARCSTPKSHDPKHGTPLKLDTAALQSGPPTRVGRSPDASLNWGSTFVPAKIRDDEKKQSGETGPFLLLMSKMRAWSPEMTFLFCTTLPLRRCVSTAFPVGKTSTIKYGRSPAYATLALRPQGRPCQLPYHHAWVCSSPHTLLPLHSSGIARMHSPCSAALPFPYTLHLRSSSRPHRTLPPSSRCPLRAAH